MKKHYFTLVAFLGLIGCAGSSMVYHNPSVSYEQSQRDYRQCDYESSAGSYTPMGVFDSPISSGIQEGIQKVSLMNKCMFAKGYQLVDQSQVVASTVEPTIYKTVSEFDIDELSWLSTPGTGGIIGNSFLRKVDGAIVSCAGQAIMLFPSSNYADERIGYLYQSTESGINTERVIDESDPRYLEMMSKTMCDVDGRFKFKNLSEGTYYVVSTIRFGNPPEGANLMRKVTIRNDEIEEITMSN